MQDATISSRAILASLGWLGWRRRALATRLLVVTLRYGRNRCDGRNGLYNELFERIA
jgi:hypothetical protein